MLLKKGQIFKNFLQMSIPYIYGFHKVHVLTKILHPVYIETQMCV